MCQKGKQFKMFPIKHKWQSSGVATIKMHACYGVALNWMALLDVERGYV